MGHLVYCSAGVRAAFFKNSDEGVGREGKAVVFGEAIDEVVFAAGTGAEVVNGGDSVLLNDFVRSLATEAGFDRFHHEGGGHEEGEVVGVFLFDDRFIGIHLREDGEKGFEETIGGEEGIGEHDAANDRARDVAFVPLVARKSSGHGEVSFEDGVEAIDALAGAGVHLVWHGAGASLSGGEALASGFVSGHEAEGFTKRAGRGGEIGEGAHGGEIEAARVDLTDVDVEIGNAEVGDDTLFELGNFGSVAIEEGNGVHLGADGALEAADLVVGDEVFERDIGSIEFFAEHRDALAKGGGLGGDVVGAGGDDEVFPLFGAFADSGEGGDGLVTDNEKGAEDLKLFDILGEVAGGHALVDLLVAGEVVKLFNAGFDVMSRDALALGNGGEVDLVDDLFVSGNCAGRDFEAEVGLSLHDRNPELAFKDDAAFGRPDVGDGGRGVAFGEDVLNHEGDGNAKFWKKKL